MATMTGKEVLMELLLKEGVRYVFGIPGATEVRFMAALEKYPDMQYILGLQEVVVAGMAEGYARMSGKPGFLNLHTGTGLSAAVPMLLNAKEGHVPLVVTAGQQDSRFLQKDPHLAGDLIGTAKLFAKWHAEILYAEEIPVMVQRAFKTALQPPTGPVLLSLPQNIMDQTMDFTYMPDTPLLTEFRPDQKAIDLAAELLLNPKNPVILVESGVARDNALYEVTKLAELIGARVAQPWMADVNFPVQHPQYFGDAVFSNAKIKEMIETTDILVLIGCPQFSTSTYQPLPIKPNQTKIIQIDDNPWEIGKNFPVNAGIQGNIKTSLHELNSLLAKNMTAGVKGAVKTRIGEIALEKKAIIENYQKLDDAEKDNVPISISRLMRELKAAIKPGTVIVDDCWSSSETLRRTLNLSEPKSFQRARRGGSIGWGLPGALGVKLGAPDLPVVAVSGDGSAMWSIQSLWTAAHNKIPVTFIITANATYRQVKLMRRNMLGGELTERHAGMDMDDPIIDFCRLAESMGVHGDKVERPEDLARTLKDALNANEPRLVEVKVENKATP